MVGAKPAARAGCSVSRSRPHPWSPVCGTRHWRTGTPRHTLQGVRRVTLSRIRYYVYYRVSGDALEVLAF